MVSLQKVEIKKGDMLVGAAPEGAFDEANFTVTVESLHWPNALEFLQQKVQLFAYYSTHRKFRESMKLDSVTGDYRNNAGRATFTRGF